MNEFFNISLWTLGVSISYFVVFWVISLITKKASIIDIAWGFYFSLISVFYFLRSGQRLEFIHVLSFLVIGFWSIRLGLYLIIRYLHENEEDKRYIKIKKNWNATGVSFVKMFVFQGFIAALVSSPIYFIFSRSAENKTIIYFGLGLMFLSTVLESVADYQLFGFKKDESNKGKICDKGLWYYTRHPNYFFEWGVWFSLAIQCFGYEGNAYFGISSAILMFVFLNYVSGIPFLEEDARKGIYKKSGEKEYYATTPAFFPNPFK